MSQPNAQLNKAIQDSCKTVVPNFDSMTLAEEKADKLALGKMHDLIHEALKIHLSRHVENIGSLEADHAISFMSFVIEVMQATRD